MALSKKAAALLKQIYDHHKSGNEELVKEDPDEALEYVLGEIVERLTNPQRSDSSPLYRVTEDAVGGLRSDRADRRRAKQNVASKEQAAKTS